MTNCQRRLANVSKSIIVDESGVAFRTLEGSLQCMDMLAPWPLVVSWLSCVSKFRVPRLAFSLFDVPTFHPGEAASRGAHPNYVVV